VYQVALFTWSTSSGCATRANTRIRNVLIRGSSRRPISIVHAAANPAAATATRDPGVVSTNSTSRITRTAFATWYTLRV
jgi:hypothetical protein